MLEIVKSNSKASNSNIRLIVAILAINIAKLAATTLALNIARLAATTLAIAIAATPLKLAHSSACKAASYASSAA
jgi:hypothetical protein